MSTLPQNLNLNIHVASFDEKKKIRVGRKEQLTCMLTVYFLSVKSKHCTSQMLLLYLHYMSDETLSIKRKKASMATYDCLLGASPMQTASSASRT